MHNQPVTFTLAKIMTTKEVSEYLKLHEITICKYAAQGKIPAIRIYLALLSCDGYMF